jgi:hypothetical protein
MACCEELSVMMIVSCMYIVVWVGRFSSFVALDGWRTVERVAPARPRAGQGRPRGLSHDGKLKVVESKGQAERHGTNSSLFSLLSIIHLHSLTLLPRILPPPSIHLPRLGTLLLLHRASRSCQIGAY